CYVFIDCSLSTRFLRARPTRRSSDLHRELAGQPPQFHGEEREPRRRVDVGLQSAAADVEDVLAGDAEVDERLPHRQPRVDVAPGDRKSTRLNSSHVKISYAVFCLKKK